MKSRVLVLLGCVVGCVLSGMMQQAQAQMSQTIIAGHSVWYDGMPIEPGRIYTTSRPIDGSGGEVEMLVRANESLRQRADALEREVFRLRSELKRVSVAPPDPNQLWLQQKQEREARMARRARRAVCSLKTPFNGIFTGRGETRMEALAEALEKCQQSGANLCSEKNSQCEKP